MLIRRSNGSSRGLVIEIALTLDWVRDGSSRHPEGFRGNSLVVMTTVLEEGRAHLASSGDGGGGVVTTGVSLPSQDATVVMGNGNPSQ